MARLRLTGFPIEHAAPVMAVLVLTLMFAHVEIERLTFPFDLEWMTGSILDHVERVQEGQAVYAAPTVDWIPFMYPPLYYWVAAAAGSVAPLYLAARGVSLLSAVITAACIWRLVRHRGAAPVWCVIAAGLFFAAFGYTGFWFDLERVDMLCIALIMLAGVILEESHGTLGALAAGAILGAAFFAKQPAVLFIAGGIAGLLLQREQRRATVFGVVAIATVVGGIVWLHVSTDGWFTYYVLEMPLRHGVKGTLVRTFFTSDLARAYTLTLATAAAAVALLRAPRVNTLSSCFLLAGFWAAAGSRIHEGGWDNVLLFWVAPAIPAAAVLAARVERHLTQTAGRALVGGLVAAQCIVWAYRPDAVHPKRGDAERAAAFVTRVRADEAKYGEVLVTSRGHITSARHYHTAALFDVLRADAQVPSAVVRAFAERRFGELILSSIDDMLLPNLPEAAALRAAVGANYYVADVIVDPPRPLMGWIAFPALVMHRRTQPLGDVGLRELQRRLDVERHIADLRATLRGTGGGPPQDGTVEEIAREWLER